MFAKKFLQKKALSGCHDLHHSCAVRLLDASDLISVTFQVKSRYPKSGVTGRFAPLTFRPLDVSPLHWTFRPWTFRPLYVSPHGRFAPRTFRPCTFRPLDVSPTHWTFRPRLLFYVFVVFRTPERDGRVDRQNCYQYLT